MSTVVGREVARQTGRAPRRAVVIGAGIGGLATAIRLLAMDYRVTVLEARPTIGGRAGQINRDGYTFDTGPSLLTMPWLVDELFALAGANVAARVRLRRLDPFYRIAWHGDDRSFLFSGDHESMVKQIGRFSLRDATRYDAFLDASRRIYQETILVAGRKSFPRLTDFLPLVPRMARLGALRSVDGFVGQFFNEPHVRQAFNFHPLFIGGDPYRVPGVYASLAYLQIVDGVWYVEGGIYSLIEAMGDLIREGGGTILTDCPAAEIVVDGTRVRGVRTTHGDMHPAELVVSNADVVTTHESLLGRRIRRSPRLTMSCFLLYLGTRKAFPHLHHHTLLVGESYRDFIRDVTRRHRLPATLSLYVHAPTRTEPGMAPPGGEALSVLLPVPNLTARLDWDKMGDEVRDRIIEELESTAGLGLQGLRNALAVEQRWTPLDFRDRLGAAEGNAFALEPTLSQSAYFRQPNRDRHLLGLYFVGGGSHPGAGIPGVLLGAQVTCDLIAGATTLR